MDVAVDPLRPAPPGQRDGAGRIAFITCVSDEAQYRQCRSYLEALEVPEGYGLDAVTVRGAPSMAAGYQAGMEATPGACPAFRRN